MASPLDKQQEDSASPVECQQVPLLIDAASGGVAAYACRKPAAHAMAFDFLFTEFNDHAD